MKYILLIAIVTAACGKGDKDGSAAATTGACADSIGKAITAMTDKVKGRMGGGDNPLVERMTKLQAAMVSHCNADKWPDAVIKCFDTAASRNDMKKCQEPLTDDQKMALEADVTKLMIGGGSGRRHGGSGMVHGDMPGSGSGAPAGSGSDAPAGSGSAAPTGAGSGS